MFQIPTMSCHRTEQGALHLVVHQRTMGPLCCLLEGTTLGMTISFVTGEHLNRLDRFLYIFLTCGYGFGFQLEKFLGLILYNNRTKTQTQTHTEPEPYLHNVVIYVQRYRHARHVYTNIGFGEKPNRSTPGTCKIQIGSILSRNTGSTCKIQISVRFCQETQAELTHCHPYITTPIHMNISCKFLCVILCISVSKKYVIFFSYLRL